MPNVQINKISPTQMEQAFHQANQQFKQASKNPQKGRQSIPKELTKEGSIFTGQLGNFKKAATTAANIGSYIPVTPISVTSELALYGLTGDPSHLGYAAADLVPFGGLVAKGAKATKAVKAAGTAAKAAKEVTTSGKPLLSITSKGKINP